MPTWNMGVTVAGGKLSGTVRCPWLHLRRNGIEAPFLFSCVGTGALPPAGMGSSFLRAFMMPRGGAGLCLGSGRTEGEGVSRSDLAWSATG